MRFFGTGPPRRRAAAWPGECERRSGADTLRNARAISSSERVSCRNAERLCRGGRDSRPQMRSRHTRSWPEPAFGFGCRRQRAGPEHSGRQVSVGGPPFLSPEFREIAAGTGALPDISGGRRTAYPAVVPEPGFSDDAAGAPVRRAVVGGYGCPGRERGALPPTGRNASDLRTSQPRYSPGTGTEDDAEQESETSDSFLCLFPSGVSVTGRAYRNGGKFARFLNRCRTGRHRISGEEYFGKRQNSRYAIRRLVQHTGCFIDN